jgi:hypothetical protein
MELERSALLRPCFKNGKLTRVGRFPRAFITMSERGLPVEENRTHSLIVTFDTKQNGTFSGWLVRAFTPNRRMDNRTR